MLNTHASTPIVFFGTSAFSVSVLETLASRGITPSLIVTAPDKPQGRKLILTPPPAKMWADAHGVAVIQPSTLRAQRIAPETLETLRSYADGVFIVASYGLIIPKDILDIPQHKTLNIHPSLLPALRGPSPIQTAILQEKETGVTIMRLDEEVDHGPIVAQQKTPYTPWPPYYDELEHALACAGANLLADILPQWINGAIAEHEQDHMAATYSKKISKEDGLISLDAPAEENLRKIRALSRWPGAYFFADRRGTPIRVRIKSASLSGDTLFIERVVPEGKREMDYRDFLNGL